ncbi:MAG: hypothetical protein F6K31_14215 [Symploca sp. SIO2G7]|nr:hypothetical protein [Symploca sp. SIO2G7]
MHQKYLRRSIRTINSNAETVKSYHCCQMSCCLLPPFTSQFSTGVQDLSKT